MSDDNEDSGNEVIPPSELHDVLDVERARLHTRNREIDLAREFAHLEEKQDERDQVYWRRQQEIDAEQWDKSHALNNKIVIFIMSVVSFVILFGAYIFAYGSSEQTNILRDMMSAFWLFIGNGSTLVLIIIVIRWFLSRNRP